ncbi:MAG: hypothetical protein HZA51_11145 [Planctomycetes bacterium]|nr:hypothetical protein [Planctomycetota bacterium]
MPPIFRFVAFTVAFCTTAPVLAGGAGVTASRTSHTPPADQFVYEPVPEASIIAFPGAYGFGTKTFGGRGLPGMTPRVMFVTTLADKIWDDATGRLIAAPGSLRAALEAGGPRFVIFRVGGTIILNEPIRIDYPYVYVAGQTAPPPGVVIAHRGIIVRTNDVVLRYLRFRTYFDEALDYLQGLFIQALTLDRVGNHEQVVSNHTVTNVVVDHCSFAWCIDDTIGIGDIVENVTIQNCIMAEGATYGNDYGPAGSGMLCATSSDASVPTNLTRLSLHYNIFAHNSARNPRIKSGAVFDIRNNIGYNWAESFPVILDCGAHVNFINNEYYMGADSPQSNTNLKDLIIVSEPTGPLGRTALYLSNNIAPRRLLDTQPQWDVGVSYFVRNTGQCGPTNLYCQVQLSTPLLQAPYQLVSPVTVPPVLTMSHSVMQQQLLASAGVSGAYRDGVDQRLCDELAYVVSKNPVGLPSPGYDPAQDPGLRRIGPHDGTRADVLWFKPQNDPDRHCLPRQYRMLPGQSLNDAKRAMLSRMTCTFADGLQLPRDLDRILALPEIYQFEIVARIIPDRELIERMYPANETPWLPTDRDLDGVPDYVEWLNRTNPNRPDSTEDSDGNGYLNIEDYINSITP